jgi:hypothetical protein
LQADVQRELHECNVRIGSLHAGLSEFKQHQRQQQRQQQQQQQQAFASLTAEVQLLVRNNA